MSDKELIPTVYMTVGAPGSGKSTWWEHSTKNGFFPDGKAIRINMDAIRKDLCGNEEDQSKNHIVAKIADQNLKSALAHKIPIIIWDNTSARPRYRKSVVKEARKADYEVVVVWFDLPIETILERNSKRARVVPEDVVRRIYNDIKKNPPTMDEGFDNIIYVRE